MQPGAPALPAIVVHACQRLAGLTIKRRKFATYTEFATLPLRLALPSRERQTIWRRKESKHQSRNTTNLLRSTPPLALRLQL